MAISLVPLVGLASQLIDKIIPDPVKRAEAKAKIQQMEMEGELKEIDMQLSAILMEAQSKDAWTSRARPGFLYVVYIYILAALPYGFLFAFVPEAASRVTDGMSAWLASIPEPMWWLFGAGYLGYTGARSIDKSVLTSAKSKFSMNSLFGER